MRLALAYGIALACLLQAVDAAAQPAAQKPPPTPPAARPAAPLYITSQTDVLIPFTVHATDAQGRLPAKVLIYVSLDQGRNWDLYQELTPTEKGFRFRAKRDAEFWFSTQTVNADGSGDRPETRTAQMRLIIDTMKPRLQIVPQVDESGKIYLQWTAADPFLAANSVRLEWQDPAVGTWQEVTPTDKPNASRSQYDARAVVAPASGTTRIVLRGEAADSAGNKTVVSQQFEITPGNEEGKTALLPAPRNSGALAQRWTPEQNDPYARQPAVGNPASAPRVQPNTALATVGPSSNLPPPVENSREQESPPQLVRNPYSSTAGTTARPTNTGETLPPPRMSSEDPFQSRASTEELPSFNGPTNEYQPSRPAPRPEVIDSQPIAPPRRVETLAPPQGDRPRMTATKRFSLDYDIESIGPEGVADVELWGTADQGRTWAKWGTDPDRASPFEVEVANEATYGFRIVIVGKNGLASNTPQAGDAADIWVGVDLAKPRARLTGATIAGGEHAGKLEIRWDADDEHFGSRPITLAVSDKAAGPFTPIAAGLPNTGRYFWEFDPRIRRQLFIRLEAQDEAGNFSVDQLTDPILIEGLAPKGRIRDIAPAPATPAPTSPPQAFRSPLFR